MPAGSLDSLIFSPRDFERYNGHHRLHTFELPHSPTNSSTKPVDSKSSANDVVNWLGDPGPKSYPDEPTMKILLIQTHNQSTAKRPTSPRSQYISLSPEPTHSQTSEVQSHVKFVQNVFNGLDLPLAAFAAYIKAHITFVCVPPTSTNIHNNHQYPKTTTSCTKYYCSGTSWTITWSYSHSLKHTAAVMFHREGDGDERKNEVLSDLLRLQTHLSHPMLLGYIKTKVSLSFTFDMLDDMNRETLALEQEIGFPTWNWVLDREMPGRGVGETQDQAVEGFNILSGKLTNIRFRLRTFQQQIKFISRCNEQYRLGLDPTSPNFQSSIHECNELDSFMNVMWDYTFIHLFDADSLGERLQNAMSSVFQLTAQRDSRASLAIADINNDLAWQGKTTNRSMMTIAFVSLLFLPGTFVASFFDTPIFNFSTPSDHRQVVVPLPFWIYWTVSGVLTIGLWIGYLGYLRRTKEMDSRERESERRQFREKIRRRRGEGGVAAVLFEGRDSSITTRDGPTPTVEKRHGHCWGIDMSFDRLKNNGPFRRDRTRDDKKTWTARPDIYGIPLPLNEPKGYPTPTMDSGMYINRFGASGKGYAGGNGWPTGVYGP